MNLSASTAPSISWTQDSITCNNDHEETGVIHLGLEARGGFTPKMTFTWQNFTSRHVAQKPGEEALGREQGRLCTEARACTDIWAVALCWGACGDPGSIENV